MSKYFGTDGFRGEAGITLTSEHAYKIGRFLGWYYSKLKMQEGKGESAKIVIGKDTQIMLIVIITVMIVIWRLQKIYV